MVADVRGGYGQSYIMMNNKGWVYNLNISRQTLKPFDSPSNHANRMIKVYIFSFGIVYYQKLSNNKTTYLQMLVMFLAASLFEKY